MADHKNPLIKLLPPGTVKSGGKTINWRNKYSAARVENIGTGITLPPFKEWVAQQKANKGANEA